MKMVPIKNIRPKTKNMVNWESPKSKPEQLPFLIDKLAGPSNF